MNRYPALLWVSSSFSLVNFHWNFLQFVCASQPFNALAYIFDGLHYGVSDFSYAASSMVSDHLLMFSFGP